MSKNITNSESISTLKSKKKNKSQEIGESTKDSIKNILKSNGNKILFNDKEIQTIIENKREGDLGNLTIEQKIQYDNILLIANCLKNLDRTKMKNYIHRKNEYLEKNRTISKENFEELFRGSGKFGKAEINQQNLGICYAYTGFELLKKTNGFDEMIQTNLKETGNGWEVRMPFCDKNGKWITVNESEIDKMFSITRKTFNINSKSEYKGFKILEIAFIKQSIIKKYFNKKENIPEELEDAYIQYSKTGDISLTGELITKLEGGLVEDMLKNILPKNYIISNISDERLNNEMKDLAFNQFSKGLFKIDLQMNRKNVGENNIGPSTTIVKNFKIGKTIIINNAIIINKKTKKQKKLKTNFQ